MSESTNPSSIIANNTIKNHVIASMGLSLIPVPLVDISALTVTQMNMLQKLCVQYAVPYTEEDLKPLLMSLLGASLPVLGIVGASSFVKVIPGIGTLGGSASLCVLAGTVTYAVGQTFALHFAQGGTLDDLEVQQAKAFFKQELKNGKQRVQSWREEFQAIKAEAAAAEEQSAAKGS